MLNLKDLFTYTDQDLSMTEEEEAQAIRDAQAGDESAKERLLLAYGKALRAAVGGNYRLATIVNPNHGTNNLDPEDLRSAAVMAVLETIEDHDPERNPRIAGRVTQRLARELSDYATTGAGFQIPERTLSRYYGILREADGDADLAYEIAPDFHMKRETFRAVQAAVRPDSLDDATGTRPEAYSANGGGFAEDDGWTRSDAASLFGEGREVLADVEDRVLVEAAFQALDDEEARIVELRYGFRATDDYAHGEEIPDGAVAEIVGLTRPTVQRRRGAALDKMRKAIGATPITDQDETQTRFETVATDTDEDGSKVTTTTRTYPDAEIRVVVEDVRDSRGRGSIEKRVTAPAGTADGITHRADSWTGTWAACSVDRSALVVLEDVAVQTVECRECGRGL